MSVRGNDRIPDTRQRHGEQLVMEPQGVLGLLAHRDVLHGEQDALDMIEAAGVQHDRPRANLLKVMGHRIVIEDGIPGQNLFQQGPQLWDIPLPIAQLIDVLAFRLRRTDVK